MPYPFTGGDVGMFITNSQVLGIFIDDYDDEYDIAGTVTADGTLNGDVFFNGQLGATMSGKLSGSSGSGIWNDFEGCQGTWTVTKQ
jgi:hypothetical protein